MLTINHLRTLLLKGTCLRIDIDPEHGHEHLDYLFLLLEALPVNNVFFYWPSVATQSAQQIRYAGRDDGHVKATRVNI